MKISELLKETTTSGAIAVAPVGVGSMQSRNPDGTVKNALDMKDNLLGNKKKPKKKTKA